MSSGPLSIKVSLTYNKIVPTFEKKDENRWSLLAPMHLVFLFLNGKIISLLINEINL